MIYTEDRDTFARDLIKAPWLARMLDEASRYAGRMDKEAREHVLEVALDRFYRESLRGLKSGQDFQRTWSRCLQYAMLTRPWWRIWANWNGFIWVKGIRWRGWRD